MMIAPPLVTWLGTMSMPSIGCCYCGGGDGEKRFESTKDKGSLDYGSTHDDPPRRQRWLSESFNGQRSRLKACKITAVTTLV